MSIYIYNLTYRERMPKNYFVYYPPGVYCGTFGVELTSAGFTNIPPDTKYPAGQHPRDHHFSWEKGRRLSCLQLVYISKGRGCLETSATTGMINITAGSAFILFPGVWHRYRPAPDIGWDEHWIELHGVAVDGMLERRLLCSDSPLLVNADQFGMASYFDNIHSWIQSDALGHVSRVTSLAAHMLCLMTEPSAREHPTAHTDAVQCACERIAENISEPLHMERLAKSLNLSYSVFRRSFKSIVGVSPKRYHTYLRLRKAADLLISSGLTISEIAAQLGFDSPYHFSAQFKKQFGSAPNIWRKRALSVSSSLLKK